MYIYKTTTHKQKYSMYNITNMFEALCRIFRMLYLHIYMYIYIAFRMHVTLLYTCCIYVLLLLYVWLFVLPCPCCLCSYFVCSKCVNIFTNSWLAWVAELIDYSLCHWSCFPPCCFLDRTCLDATNSKRKQRTRTSYGGPLSSHAYFSSAMLGWEP